MEVGNREVENNEIKCSLGRQLERGPPRAHDLDLKPFVSHDRCHRLGDVGMVVDDKNAGSSHRSRGHRASKREMTTVDHHVGNRGRRSYRAAGTRLRLVSFTRA